MSKVIDFIQYAILVAILRFLLEAPAWAAVSVALVVGLLVEIRDRSSKEIIVTGQYISKP